MSVINWKFYLLNNLDPSKSTMNKKKDVLFVRRELVVDRQNSNDDNDLLEIVDLNCDDECDSESAEVNKRLSNRFYQTSNQIDINTAKNLKKILFGSSTAQIGPEWRYQYFEFETRVSELWYGLVQKKGGPCGVLAALQGFLFIEFFYKNQVNINLRGTNLKDYLNQCLASAVGNILWQIGGSRQKVTVIYESDKRSIEDSFDFNSDGITERLHIRDFNSAQDMYNFLFDLLSYNPFSIGCVSLSYSCIMTRGLDQIIQDYDIGSTQCLVTKHHLHCTQELVNLCLVGRAVSNVFDRSYNCNDLILQGITRQSSVGFLTLHEHNGDFTVGSCYKNPMYPIFVVLSENHFTVLFSKEHILNDHFNLHYYDGLLKQDKEICLSIDLETKCNDQSIVPIECVIRTKWPRASIDWNGTMKIF